MSGTRIGVLIIHGTMGSVLKKEGKKIWPLHNGTQDHYVSSLTPLTTAVEPSHMLVTYQALKLALKLKFDIVEEFVYDWRLNNLDHSSLLKSKIAGMNVDEIHIVAHSMGGIIAKICLNEHEGDADLSKVKKLITLGTPWKGSMESVKTLLYGSRIPQKYLTFIEKEASREISTHFPSVYQLLPSEDFLRELKTVNCVPYFLNDSYYDKFEDFFKGVLHDKFAQNHLYDRVFNEYYELLNKDIAADIELHEIIGTGKPTVRMICENTRKEPYVSYDEGDGTVPLFSAYSNLENRDNYFAYFVNKASHNGLPLNIDIIQLVKDIIREKEFSPDDSIFNDLESDHYQKFSGYISKVACPVDISIRDKDGNIIYGNIETINEEEIRDLLQKDYEVDNIGSTTYVIFDESDETNISNFNGLVIDAYDKGLTSISLEKYENGKITKRKAFKTFEIDTSLQAELILDKDTEESSLILKKDGEIQDTFHLDDISIDEEKLNLPTTFISFSGDNYFRFKNDDIYFGKDLITMQIDKIIPGDFKPKQTFVLINGKEYVVENNVLDFNSTVLSHGKNEIEIFTIDEYDYSEAKRKIIFYYFHQVTSKVNFLFRDKYYLAHLEEDAVYSRIATTYELTNSLPVYKYNNEDGLTGNQVIYHDIERALEIIYTDIFDNEVKLNFVIDEKAIKKIIKGAATVTDVQKFTEKLNLENPTYLFHLGKSGNYTVLNDHNLNGSQSFEIFSETSSLHIFKNVELDISFETLSEHISLSSEEGSYNFVFKVLDIDQQYVRDLSLTGEVTFFIENGPGKDSKEFKEKYEVEYIPSSGSYKLTMDLKGIIDLLEGYWRPEEKVLSTAKLEIINSKNKAVIRGLDLKIAK